MFETRAGVMVVLRKMAGFRKCLVRSIHRSEFWQEKIELNNASCMPKSNQKYHTMMI